MRRLALVIVLAGAASLAGDARAGPGWYWSPRACASAILERRVALGDGRAVVPVQAVCKGSRGCSWNGSHTQLLYSGLDAAVRSANGVVRALSFAPSGRNAWRAEGPVRTIAVHLSAAAFASVIRGIDASNAQAWKYHRCVAGRFAKGAGSDRARAVA